MSSVSEQDKEVEHTVLFEHCSKWSSVPDVPEVPAGKSSLSKVQLSRMQSAGYSIVRGTRRQLPTFLYLGAQGHPQSTSLVLGRDWGVWEV